MEIRKLLYWERGFAFVPTENKKKYEFLQQLIKTIFDWGRSYKDFGCKHEGKNREKLQER